MSFKEGDKVKVITKNSIHRGATGTVLRFFEDEKTCTVQIQEDWGNGLVAGAISGFFVTELEKVDETQEALIELAETLDRARLQANAVDEFAIQSQRGVYGQIAQALIDTLEVIFVDQVEDHSLFAARAYTRLLDGNTVREALAQVVEG